MATVTIPKKVTKGDDLIVISRREYEILLRNADAIKSFIPTLAEKKALKKARDEWNRGKLIPWQKLKRELAH